MMGTLGWICVGVLTALSVGEGIALLILAGRMRNLTGLRGDIVRLRSRVDELEDRPAARTDSQGSPLPGGPMRAKRAEGGTIPTLIEVPSLSRMPERQETGQGGLVERYGELWSRADAGESALEIARDLGLAVGQVELILNLRKRVDARVPV